MGAGCPANAHPRVGRASWLWENTDEEIPIKLIFFLKLFVEILRLSWKTLFSGFATRQNASPTGNSTLAAEEQGGVAHGQLNTGRQRTR